jgi:hypothetical protein
VVPDDKVLQRSDNPTGHAGVCRTERAGIYAMFVRPKVEQGTGVGRSATSVAVKGPSVAVKGAERSGERPRA